MNDTPTPAPAPAPAPSPAPAPAPAPAAVTRPEAIAESFWDASANTIKLDAFTPHYTELATFHKTETERQAALAARKPEDIKFEVKLPEGVKAPEGLDVKINPDDPRVPVLRDMAIKNGWTQETVDALVALDAKQQIDNHAAEQSRIAAEDQKLGANAKDRKAAVGNWLKGMKDRNELSGDEYEAVRVYATDAATVTALEKIMAKAAGHVPGHQPGNPPAAAQVPQAERWYGATTPKKVS
jgi:hypothetical protein